MSDLVVITFEDVDEASKVRKALSEVESGGYLSLDDSAVVTKDASGKIQVKDEVDRGIKVGAIGGGVLGLLIGSVFFPFASLLVGALAGAAVGSVADLGIEKKFIKDVSDSLQPGSSALFIIVRDADPNFALAALKPYQGTVYHTTLTSEDEESLRRVLSKRT